LKSFAGVNISKPAGEKVFLDLHATVFDDHEGQKFTHI